MNKNPIGPECSRHIASTVFEFNAAVTLIANAPAPEEILAGKRQFVEKYFALAITAPDPGDFLGSPESVTYEQMAAYVRAVCRHALSVLGESK